MGATINTAAINKWLNELPNKIKNYPPDKKIAVICVGVGAFFIIISLLMFIIF